MMSVSSLRRAAQAPWFTSMVTVLLLVLMLIAGAVGYDGFLSPQVMLNLLIDNAFLLVVAIGSNYALFFDSANTGGNAQDQRRTIVSLLTANLTIVGSFGMLALSSVPVLAILGTTVGLGTVLALLFSAALARPAS